jgi:crossover junction endodeoxyribonuclease RuvC
VARILGIDPGSRAAGYGVVDTDGQRSRAVHFGVIRVPADLSLGHRLNLLHNELVKIVDEYAPDEAAIEEVFTAKNARSALVLGQARGVLLLAAARHCEVYEYAARAVKKAVAGYGQADKGQVGHMVKVLLGLPKVPAQDAADALAIALCHAHTRPMRESARAALARAAAR